MNKASAFFRCICGISINFFQNIDYFCSFFFISLFLFNVVFLQILLCSSELFFFFFFFSFSFLFFFGFFFFFRPFLSLIFLVPFSLLYLSLNSFKCLSCLKLFTHLLALFLSFFLSFFLSLSFPVPLSSQFGKPSKHIRSVCTGIF